MTKDILIRFLNNNCTEKELHEVLQWAESNALSEEGKELGYNDWKNYQEETNLVNDEKFTALFDKIQEKIGEHEKTAENKTRNVSMFTNWLTRAAAIFLIPVLAFLFYTLNAKRIEEVKYTSLYTDSLEVVAPIGSRTVVQLSDGTTVHLNYGSKIKYPHIFNGNTREIALQGEGYFDVAHNSEKPFIVKTSNLNIKALGTSFNVLAYTNDNTVETTLVNGKVVLEQRNSDGSSKAIGSMEPGQHVDYNRNTHKVSGTKGDIEKYISWKNGKLIFEDTPILEVTEKLSRMFNVEIEVADEIKDYIYTVTFIDEPLFQILDLMTMATPVKYSALPREKLADGTYSKQKIVIEKRKN